MSDDGEVKYGEPMTISDATALLSPGRERIYNIIVDYWRDTGFFPTVRKLTELAEESQTNVYHHLLKLVEAGLIERSDDRLKAGSYKLAGIDNKINPDKLIIPLSTAFRKQGDRSK